MGMANNTIVGLTVVLAAVGCARLSRTTGTLESPSGSIADVSGLAGHWQGSIDEIGGAYLQGRLPLDVTIAPDGTWRGSFAKAPASGRARLHNGRLVLEGTAGDVNGLAQSVYLDLMGDSSRRWGVTVGDFHEREDHASVTLRRLPS